MKKLLLLLAFTLVSLGNAQIKTQVSDYAVCDDNNDGIASFDLTAETPEILAGVTVPYSVRFYPSSMGAEMDMDIIGNPTAFANTSNPQTIYYRAVDSQTSAVTIGSFKLTVNSLPTAAISQNVTICSGTSANITFTGTPNAIVTYTINGAANLTTTLNASGISIVSTGNINANATYDLLSVVNAATACAQSLVGKPNTNVIVTASTAPIINKPSDNTVCDDNYDGVACFDLSTKDAEISTAPDIQINYYRTQADTQNNVNPLNKKLYCNNQNPFNQTLYIRVSDPSTACASFTTLQLIVNPKPTINPNLTDYKLCDTNNPGDGSEVFDLSTKYAEIIKGQTSMTVSYYLTQFDATNQTSGIALPNLFTNTANPQTIWYTIQNITTGCVAIGSFKLVVSCGNSSCPKPTDIAMANITATTATIDWTGGPEGSWDVAVGYDSASNPDSLLFFNTIEPQFFAEGLSLNTCNYIYVRTVCNNSKGEWVGPITYCPECLKNGSCPGNIHLTAFLDTNNNEVKDTGEQNFNNGTFVYDINNSGNPLYGYSNGNGFSLMESNPANSYNFSFAVNSELTPYYTSSSTYANITIAAGSNATYYFPIKQLQPYNDLEIYLYGNNPRPGFQYSNYIYYRNRGIETVNSGTITFTKSPKVSITNIPGSGATITPTGFTYTFSNLAPNEERYIYVDMQVPAIPTANLGDMITSSASIEPLAGDLTPGNNSSSLSKVVVGSYDPNEMSESHGREIVFNDFTADDYLYYTITFENTGTADAEFIRVEDLLDTALDPNTLVMLNSDHTYNMRRTDNNLVWNFYDINLPPTATSPNESHGFIQFKIKPKAGYMIGTLIPNKANIYFDFNPAIETNTFNTEFTEALANPSFTENSITLYPNPATNFIQINTQNTDETLKHIVISDMLGKTIKSVSNLSDNQTFVDISNLSKGIYMVEITSENNLKLTKKLVIQ